MEQYIEITNSLTSRGKFYPIKALKNFIKPNMETYRSYFSYDKVLVDKIKEGKEIGLARTSGKFYLNQIVLDIDKGENTFNALLVRLLNISNILIKEYDLEKNFQIWFSGRGFHLHLPNIFDFQPSNNLPDIVRSTIEAIFPTVDTKPIHKRGLIRVGGSMNLKTSLYKIPLAEEEIWFLKEEDLLKWSAENRKIDLIKPKDFPIYPDLIVFPEKRKEIQNTLPLLNVKTKANDDVTCMQRILARGPINGKRHNDVMLLTSWIRRKNLPVQIALANAYSFVGEKAYEWTHLVQSNYANEYNFSCDNKTLKEYCSPTCIHYQHKSYLPKIFGMQKMQEQYAKSLEGGWKTNAINIADFFGITDEKGMWLRPGHVIGIVADTGLSKSSLMQNLCLAYRDFGKIFYINTEMPDDELWERFLTIDLMITNEEARERTSNGEILGERMNHIQYLATIPKYEDLRKDIKVISPKILIIDVIDDINFKGGRDIYNQEKMYADIKQLAKELKMIVFMVHHVTKSSVVDKNGKTKPMDKHAGKGSSAFEQKVDLLLGIDGDVATPYRTIRHLKGRSTMPFVTHFYVDPNTFKYVIIKDYPKENNSAKLAH